MALLRPLSHVAATFLQRCYRGLRTRRIVSAYKRLRHTAALRVQSAFRGWIARLFLQYLKDHYNAATAVQRMIRGLLSRATFKLLVMASCVVLAPAERPNPARQHNQHSQPSLVNRHTMHPGVIALQARGRGGLQRARYRLQLAGAVDVAVVAPAALLLSRLARAWLALQFIADERERRDAAIVMQVKEKAH